jgi:hypothetical protein
MINYNAVVRYHPVMVYYKKGQNAPSKEQLQKALALDENIDWAKEASQLINDL